MKSRLAIACGALLLVAAPLRAQTCLGHIPFAKAPLQLDVTLENEKDLNAYGFGASLGSAKGLFGSAEFAVAEVEGFDTRAKSLAGRLGYSWEPAGEPGMGLCPLLGLGYSWLDETIGGTRFETSATTFHFGGAVGAVVWESESLSLVPTMSVAAYFPNSTYKMNGTDVNAADDSYTLLNIGAGLHYDDRFTILPAVHYPFGRRDGNTSVSLTVGIGFGRR